MTARRALVLAALAALLGCNQDTPVTLVFSPPLVAGVQILATGGASSSSGPSSPTGGAGGQIAFVTQSSLQLGASVVTPEPATAPVANGVGTVITSDNFELHTDVDIPTGNILVTVPVTTDVAGLPGTPRRIIAENGDIQIYSVLQSGQALGVLPSGQTVSVMADLELDAPNGTIYVYGEISTSSVSGTLNGIPGGALTLNASRIVMQGTLITSGTQNAFGQQGGAGGPILMTTPLGGQGIMFRFGTMITQGLTGLVNGGNAGSITLSSLGGPVDFFGTVISPGGSVAGPYPNVTGGAGASVLILAAGPVSINCNATLNGGAAATDLDGAVGGTGGSFSVQNAPAAPPLPALVFGFLNLAGGPASAATSNGSVVGGLGGTAAFGAPAAPLLSVLSGSCQLLSSGGAGDTGGPGGIIALTVAGTSSADLILTDTTQAIGGTGVSGPGGAGGTVTLQSAGTGHVTLSGLIQTDGGGSTDGTGGDAGQVSLSTSSATGSNDVSLSATITSSAGSGGASGGAGQAGQIAVNVQSGTITQIGALEAIGGNAAVPFTPTGAIGPTAGGRVQLSTNAAGTGAISLSAPIWVMGGSSLSGSVDAVGGAPGGTVAISSAASAGIITMTPGSQILATGGAVSGGGTGGAGGTVIVSTATAAVLIEGSIDASGGAAGAPGPGGPGGQIAVSSDSSNSLAPIGSITINPGAALVANGGSGVPGGSASSDHVPASVTSPIAITLSAEFAPGKPNAGIILNQGVLEAAGGGPGGAGGDVLFQGTGATGIGLPQPGLILLAGSGFAASGDFAARN